MSTSYQVALQQAAPRTIAAVHARLPGRDIPRLFGRYLNQVYDAGRSGAIQLDGQNIFLYRNAPDRPGEVDAAFGVGLRAPFTPVGSVQPTALPTGTVATTTRVGDYAALGGAHDAIVRWCREHGHRLAGPRWEVYGHWNDNETPRTNIYYLLETERRP